MVYKLSITMIGLFYSCYGRFILRLVLFLSWLVCPSPVMGDLSYSCHGWSVLLQSWVVCPTPVMSGLSNSCHGWFDLFLSWVVCPTPVMSVLCLSVSSDRALHRLQSYSRNDLDLQLLTLNIAVHYGAVVQ